MLSKDLEEKLRGLGVNMAMENNLVIATNEIRQILEGIFLILNKDVVKITKPHDDYKDIPKEVCLDYLYGTVAVKEHLQEVGEAIKDSIATGSASVKGTLSAGVETVVSDTEIALAKDLKTDDLAEKIRSEIDE